MESQKSSTTTCFSGTGSTPKSVAPTTNTQQQQPPRLQEQYRLGFSYSLFLHIEEVRRRYSPFMRIANSKFQLTHELITKTVKNLKNCSAEDLENMFHEAGYQQNLRRNIEQVKHQLIMQQYEEQKQRFEKQQRDKFLQKQKYFLALKRRHHKPCFRGGAADM